MSTSSLIQALPEAWRSTNGLAILGSIGIHALLLAVLPYTSLDSQNANLQSSIGVVELTPEERSRVPQVAVDPSVIPPQNVAQQQAPAANQGFQSEILPPLPAPPPFLPPPPGTTPMYQMPSSDSLPPPAPVPLPPPPQTSVLSQNPFGQPPALQPNQNIQMRQISPPANAVPVPSLPPTQGLQPSSPLAQPNSVSRQVQPTIPRNLSESDRTQQEFIARRNALTQQLAANRQKADTSPTSDRDRLLEAASQQQVQRAKEREERASRLAAALKQRQANPNPAIPPASQNSDRASRLAAALKQRQSSPNPAIPPASQNSDRTSRLAALQQRLARPIGAPPGSTQSSSAQTIAQIAALQQHYQKVQQTYPESIAAAPIRKRVPVCNKKLNGGEAIIAALTDSAGKIVVGPDVISQDSPKAVQQAAIRYVKRYSFTKSATPVNQTFRLEFSHNPALCAK